MRCTNLRDKVEDGKTSQVVFKRKIRDEIGIEKI